MVDAAMSFVKDYLVVFLMIASGVVFFVAGKNGEPIDKVFRRYFWRLVLWELAISPFLFILTLVFAKEETNKWRKEHIAVRDLFLQNVTQKAEKTVKEAWYAIAWIWLEAKIKFACGFLIGMLSFGTPSMVMASEENGINDNETIATTVSQESQDNRSWTGQITSWNSWTSDGVNSNMQMFRLQGNSFGKQIGYEFLQWKTDQVNEFLIWPDESDKSSKFGIGFQQSMKGACYFELNGIQSFKAFGGNGSVFWQGKKGLSGNLSPDMFAINSAKITWPLSNKIQIGPDSKLKLVEGKAPVYRLGGVLDWQIETNTKIRFRYFVGMDGIKPNTEIWLFYALPLGGAGP